MTVGELQAAVSEMVANRNQLAALVFQDADKETFKSELISIADQLSAVNFRVSPAPFTIEEFVMFVFCVKAWLNRLVLSYAYRLNDEMQFCICETMRKWDVDFDQKMVVFTLGPYAVQKIKGNVNTHQIDFLLTLAQRTGVTFTKEPVFIIVPDEFKNHILANTPLFHEIGHFVDRVNYVTEMVFQEVFPIIRNNKMAKLIRENFPRYYGENLNTHPEAETVIKSHIEEYIADVFGAQYAHGFILYYLSYINAKHPNRYTKDHPSYNCRKNMVECFLRYCDTRTSPNLLLKAIIKYMPALRKVPAKYSEAELQDGNLSFVDTDEMLAAFTSSWSFVDREARRSGIKRETGDDYMQVLGMPYYAGLDANIKRAINDLMNS